MEKVNKSCFMCGAMDCNGIIINEEKICKACEKKILRTDVYNPNYGGYKDKLKIILFSEHVKE